MISVVLPVYNGEEYLEQSISSILKQTYTDIELVVVNDCSTDNSMNIVRRFAEEDSRIKIINNETNQKLPRSLNIGFERCRGEFFTWTSDDNIMLPNALEKLYEALIDSSADLAFSRCETIDKNGNKRGETEIYNNLNELFYNNIVLASFLYKREVHEELKGYDVSKFLVEDYDFWLRAYRKFKFVFVPDILYQIRFHGENLGVKHLEDVKLRKIMLLKENLEFVKDKKIIDGIYSEISRAYFDASNSYFDKLKGKNFIKMTMKYRGKDLLKRILKR